MWRSLFGWWRTIDWNWRNFDGLEWLWLGLTGVWSAYLIFSIAAPEFTARGPWIVLSSGQVFGCILQFIGRNRQRRGLDPPGDVRGYERHPGRPISIGALQATLGIGLLTLAVLLGVLIWIAR